MRVETCSAELRASAAARPARAHAFAHALAERRGAALLRRPSPSAVAPRSCGAVAASVAPRSCGDRRRPVQIAILREQDLISIACCFLYHTYVKSFYTIHIS